MVLFCHVTSQVAGRKNEDLLSRKSDKLVWPTVLFLDADGDVLLKHEGPRTVAGFNRTLSLLQALVDARARVAGGDQSAQLELFMAEAGLGLLDFETAKVRLEKLPRPTAERQNEIRGLMADLEFEYYRKAQRRLGEARFLAKLGEMKKNGRLPQGRNAWMFWWYLMAGASRAGKIEEWEAYLNKVKEIKAGDKQFRRFIEAQERELAVAKRKKAG